MDIKKELASIKNTIITTYLQHKNIVDFGIKAFNITQFILKDNNAEAVKVATELASDIVDQNYSINSLFSQDNGWEPIFEDGFSSIINFYNVILDKYPCQVITVGYKYHIYTLPNKAKVVAVFSANEKRDDMFHFLYNSKVSNKEEIIETLTKDLLEHIGGNCMCLSYNEKDDNLIWIQSYEPKHYPSMLADEIYHYIEKAIELKIPRSILLYSEPGTGKSCLASSIIKKFDMRTLKVRDFSNIGLDIVYATIRVLKIDAIVIDDLDHTDIDNNSSLLEFLEKIRDQVKVIIATVNSTENFHKAVLRPGRFDKIIRIERLDEKVIRDVLGEDLQDYYEKIQNWPIAYVNELSLGYKLEGKDKMDNIFKDLQMRLTGSSEEDEEDNEDD